MECLNESEEGSGKRVFRPWQNRLDKGPSNCVISDCDEELLFNIPFTGNIKLKVSLMATKKNNSATPRFYLNYKSNLSTLIDFGYYCTFQGLIIIGGEDDTHPSKLRLFKNRPHMTFDAAGSKGTLPFI